MKTAKWIIWLSVSYFLCFTMPLNAQNQNAVQSENWRKVDFEVQIGSVRGTNVLANQSNVGNTIYFVDSSSDAEAGFSNTLRVDWRFHENWRAGFYLAINSGIQRSCADYNAFWKELHGIDLEDENGTYFYRQDILCEQILEEDDLDYSFGGIGVSLTRIVPLGKRGKWTFEPTLSLGINSLSNTEPYLFLKENGSNNTRSIAYKSEKENYGLPSMGLEGKFKWQLKPSWGLSASMQYNYLLGSFDYTIEDIELFGNQSITERTFRQAIETAGFNFGLYFSF